MEPIIENNISDSNVSITLNKQLVAIVTGSSDGLGRTTAMMLAKTNYCVILANRNLSKAKIVLDEILSSTSNKNVISLELDLSSFDSIKAFVKQFKSLNIPLDCLVNNAGIYAPPFSITKDGFESQFAVNHLGVFLLTNLLLDSLSENARIVNLSSMAHRNASTFNVEDLNCTKEENYKGLTRYSDSKFYTILFTKELNRILKKRNSKILVVCLHPGVILTQLFQRLSSIAKFGLSVASGLSIITTVNTASTAIYRLAVGADPQLPIINGGEYFNIMEAQQPSYQSLVEENWRLLWSKSSEYCQIDDIGK